MEAGLPQAAIQLVDDPDRALVTAMLRAPRRWPRAVESQTGKFYSSIMARPLSITADLDPETAALVARIAKEQGKSQEAFAADAIRDAVHQDAELIEFARAGVDDLDSGRWLTHEQMIEWLRQRKAGRAS